MWALSPLALPPAAVEEMLADLQTSRPTATIALSIGPTVSTCTYRRLGAPTYPFNIRTCDLCAELRDPVAPKIVGLLVLDTSSGEKGIFGNRPDGDQ